MGNGIYKFTGLVNLVNRNDNAILQQIKIYNEIVQPPPYCDRHMLIRNTAIEGIIATRTLIRLSEKEPFDIFIQKLLQQGNIRVEVQTAVIEPVIEKTKA